MMPATERTASVAPPLLNLDVSRIDPAWALRVPAALAVRRQVLPFSAVGDAVLVACADPGDAAALEAVERFVRRQVTAVPADAASLRRALDRVYVNASSSTGRPAQPSARTASIDLDAVDDPVALGDGLLHAAILQQASDVHIEPTQDGVRVRMRVDGELEPYCQLPAAAHAGLVSRFKVLSGMNIAERRAPQDGGFKHRYGRNQSLAVDVRSATLPTKYGERMTLRLLALQTELLTLERLGMVPDDLATFQHVLDQPHGLALITGPTGSGKSTTLYAGLRRLIDRGDLNIITVEDPVEYNIAGVSQVEVDAVEKVSFHKVLRSVLRHDPDVIMVGEIRDADTLDVAIKASLTGHLVLSTLHTNSAASAVIRLIDMGLAQYMVAATLRLCVAQRLVRRLCTHCRVQRELEPAEAALLGDPGLAGRLAFDPCGCMHCGGRGFVGRVGLFEMLTVDGEVAGLIAAGEGEAAIVRAMRRKRMTELSGDAARKVLAGETTVAQCATAIVS